MMADDQFSAKIRSAKARSVIKYLTPPALLDGARRAVKWGRLHLYILSARRPWRNGYADFRRLCLERVINDVAILDIFKNSKPLPKGYGYRLDARLVEIPWLIAHLTQRAGIFLDAGSSLNYEFVLKTSQMAIRRVIILTLAPESDCLWRLGVSYLFGDLRNTLFRDNYFDEIACISTIEHIGMDNTMYAGSFEKAQRKNSQDFMLAIKEMRRVLKPHGTLYLTFPFGQYEDHGWFQQFDTALADALIEGFAPRECHETVFQYNPDGWHLSDRASCAQVQFFDVHMSKYFNSDSNIEYPPDYPAGERAVMCLRLRK